MAHPADTGLESTAKPVAATDARPDRAYQRLAGQVCALIRQGKFKTGERLPAERVLAERFDVSRTSLREAISAGTADSSPLF
jgi:GntR family transcriptional regulator, uxu operon transcriptional repressor